MFRFRRALLFYLAVAMWLSGLAAYPLLESTEGRYASMAWTMAHGGSWIEPVFNGHLLFSKPPMAYWCAALALKVLPDAAWAVRLPAILALVLCAVLAWRLALLAGLDCQRARWAGLMALLSPLAQAQGRMTTGDIFLWLGVSLGLFCLLTDRWHRRWRAGGLGLGLALGFMVKGHMVLFWVVVPAAVWVLTRRTERHRLWLIIHPLTWLVFGALAAPWYATVLLRHPDLWDYWLVRETTERVLTDAHGRSGPWWYFLPQLPLLMLPWWPELWRARRSALRYRGLWLVLIAVPLLVFSLAHSKRPNYLLPMVTPLAVLAGSGVSAGRRTWLRRRTVVWVLVVLCYPFAMGVYHWAPSTSEVVAVVAASQRPLVTFRCEPASLVFYHHRLPGQFQQLAVAERQAFLRRDGLIMARATDFPGIEKLAGMPLRVFVRFGQIILAERAQPVTKASSGPSS